MRPWAPLLLATLLMTLPTTLGAGQDLRYYIHDAGIHHSPDGTLPPIPVNLTAPHTWHRVNGTTAVEIHAIYTLRGALLETPQSTFFLQWDGQAVPDCYYTVLGGQDLEEATTLHVTTRCPLDSYQNGTHTLQVTRGNTGEPITHATLTILIHQTETVNMDLDVTIMPDTFANIVWLVWVIYFILTNLIQQPMLRVMAAFIGYGLIALPVNPEQFVVILTAQTLAVLYHIFRIFTRLE